jgi:hypothetical protein
MPSPIDEAFKFVPVEEDFTECEEAIDTATDPTADVAADMSS